MLGPLGLSEALQGEGLEEGNGVLEELNLKLVRVLVRSITLENTDIVFSMFAPFMLPEEVFGLSGQRAGVPPLPHFFKSLGGIIFKNFDIESADASTSDSIRP